MAYKTLVRGLSLLTEVRYKEAYIAFDFQKNIVSVIGEAVYQYDADGEWLDCYLCKMKLSGDIYALPKVNVFPIEDIAEDRSPIEMGDPCTLNDRDWWRAYNTY